MGDTKGKGDEAQEEGGVDNGDIVKAHDSTELQWLRPLNADNPLPNLGVT